MNTKKLNGLIKSSRPKTLLVGIAPVILGSAYSYSKHPTDFSILIFLITLACTILLQAGTNIVNEYFDFKTGVDTIERLGPKRSLLTGILKPSDLKIFFYTCFILSFILGIFLMIEGGIVISIIGISAIIIAYCYTGGPIPLSHFYLGEFLAFLFFGPVAVLGTAILQKSSVGTDLILLSCIPGFISAALMSLNNLRDINTDQMTNKKTLAIFWGENNSRFFTILLGLSPIILCLIFEWENWIVKVISLLPPILFIPLWKLILKNKELTSLNSGIAQFGKYNVLYCLLLSILCFLQLK